MIILYMWQCFLRCVRSLLSHKIYIRHMGAHSAQNTHNFSHCLSSPCAKHMSFVRTHTRSDISYENIKCRYNVCSIDPKWYDGKTRQKPRTWRTSCSNDNRWPPKNWWHFDKFTSVENCHKASLIPSAVKTIFCVDAALGSIIIIVIVIVVTIELKLCSAFSEQ